MVDHQKQAEQQPRLSHSLWDRLPLALFLLGAAWLLLSCPYAYANSDSAVFAFMGNDLLSHGVLPCLPYGQSYGFSLLPYGYALARLGLGWLLSDLMLLKTVGIATSLAGVALAGEALARYREAEGRPVAPALALFGLLLAANLPFLFMLSDITSPEQGYLCLGAVLFLASRPTSGGFWWGLVLGYAWIARPQTAVFAVPALLLRRPPWRPFLLGFVLTQLPLVLHQLLRSQAWPTYATRPHLSFQAANLEPLATVVLPILLQPRNLAGWLLLLFALGAAARALRGKPMPAAISWGSVAVLAAMTMLPSLDAGSARYANFLPLALAWVTACYTSRALLLLALLNLALVLPYGFGEWRGQQALAESTRDAVARVPHGPVLLADYWDADLLELLGQGAVRATAGPTAVCRRYGAYFEEIVAGRYYFLVQTDRIGQLATEVERVLPQARLLPLARLTLWERDYQVLRPTQPEVARLLYLRCNPAYLTARPAGSQPR